MGLTNASTARVPCRYARAARGATAEKAMARKKAMRQNCVCCVNKVKRQKIKKGG